MKLKPDDAYALRMALELLTHSATEGDGNALYLASIAISLKRIADVMERPQMPPLSAGLTFDPNSSSGFKVANSFGPGHREVGG